MKRRHNEMTEGKWNCGDRIVRFERDGRVMAGDVIATGTPSGVGPVRDGDVVEVEIEGIGVLRNHFVGAGD